MIDRHRIWAFVAAYLFSGTAFGMLNVVLPTYAVSLKIPTDKIGIIQAGMGLGLTGMVLPAGFLVDKIGSRRPFIASGFLVAGIVTVLGGLTSAMHMALAVVALGAACSFNMTATNASFFNNLKEIGEHKTGWYKGSLAVGLSLIGPTLGGWIIKGYSFRQALFLMAALWILPAVGALMFIKGSGKSASRHSDAPPFLKQAKLLITNIPLLGASLLEGLGIATVTIFSTFIAIFSLQQLELGSQHIGALLSVQGIGYASMLFFGGKLLDVLPRPSIAVIGFSAVATAYLLFGLAGGFAIVLFGSLVLGLGLGLLGLLNMATLANASGSRGSIVAFYAFVMGMFSFTGPLVGGLIGKSQGLQTLFFSVGALYLALVLSVAIRRLVSRQASAESLEVATALEEG